MKAMEGLKIDPKGIPGFVLGAIVIGLGLVLALLFPAFWWLWAILIIAGAFLLFVIN